MKIEIRNLHHRYPDGTHALKGIDLAIPGGEFLLLCGPNGSGKTTLLRLLGGLLKPTSGQLLFDGGEGRSGSGEPRRLVGMVFQEADSQILGETVREDVAFGPENLGLAPEETARRVDEALRAFNLESLANRPCHLLSGGEKRRLAIAGVLAMKPGAILLDEPFTHLDYAGVREVLRHLIRLHREGHTLVMTTHDVEKVIGHADRIAVLESGELRACGVPGEIVGLLSRFGIRPPCYALSDEERRSWLNG
jgi:biotin transport system ATP-binding protein